MIFGKKYSLEDTYGIGEIPPEDCPTYIERQAHREFQYTVKHEKQHIVVYGASRQGKTWLIERYCPSFVRVGCDAKFSREALFKAILHELNVTVGDVQSGVTKEVGAEMEAGAKVGVSVPLIVKGEVDVKGKGVGKLANNQQLSYTNIDLNNQTEVVSAIKNVLKDRFIIIENFHYLDPSVQKTFASSLKEFLYHGIRVIVVGVWKETTKLVSLASDLSNRVEPVDIGDWTVTELLEIVERGNDALNMKISDAIVDQLILHSGRNVGIFKSLLKHLCKTNGIFETQKREIEINDPAKAEEAIDKSFQEVVVPALDRIHKLASSKKSGGKGLRYYIVRAILDIMAEKKVADLLEGIPLSSVVEKVQGYEEENFQQSNIKQELLILHLREETVVAEGNSNVNFIPLFYFDQGKDKVFVVESALIVACISGKIDLSTLLGPKELYVK